MLAHNESIVCKIDVDNTVIGGFIVGVLPEGENFFGTKFVELGYQNRGTGTQSWQLIEAT